LFGAPQRGREREDGENASPASLKRVTHSDTFRFAAKYPVGAAAGFAAGGGDTSGRRSRRVTCAVFPSASAASPVGVLACVNVFAIKGRMVSV